MKPKFDKIRQNYDYNLRRLEEHLKLVEASYTISNFFSKLKLNIIIAKLVGQILTSGFSSVSEFSLTLKTSKNIVYEQALISLLTNLEIYIIDILRWIYHHDYKSSSSLRVNLPLREINQSYNVILSKVIENQLSKLGTWRKKEFAIANTSLVLDLNRIELYQNNIKEMITRRNIIIHNQGIINDQYISEVRNSKNSKKNKIGNYLKTDKEYFNKAKNHSEELINLIDEIVRKKFDQLE
jgi:hypothetical protein